MAHLDVDRLEYRWQRHADVGAWDVQAWIGGEYNKLWIKTEGEREKHGETEVAHAEALYARAISRDWHFQAGVRYEARPSPSRTSLALGLQGQAQGLDVETTAYLAEKTGAWGRIEVEYDLKLAPQLILQPRVETAVAAYSDTPRREGSGVRNVELSLRLRYEVTRQFAPYIGVMWARKVGETAGMARSADEPVTEKGIVAGVKISL
jgi:copper resistance protein B